MRILCAYPACALQLLHTPNRTQICKLTRSHRPSPPGIVGAAADAHAATPRERARRALTPAWAHGSFRRHTRCPRLRTRVERVCVRAQPRVKPRPTAQTAVHAPAALATERGRDRFKSPHLAGRARAVRSVARSRGHNRRSLSWLSYRRGRAQTRGPRHGGAAANGSAFTQSFHYFSAIDGRACRQT